MIVGRGLLATAFGVLADRHDVLVHAAGVSNSACDDSSQFQRERQLVERSLVSGATCDAFVYFSTCSIEDPANRQAPYVRHKLAMEALVAEHGGHLIVRLPQVAGRTENPHTLLNYLHRKIMTGERFAVWSRARRNVIDCDDVRTIVLALIGDGTRGLRNVANTQDYLAIDVVHALERAAGRIGNYECIDRGGGHPIDVSAIRPVLQRTGVRFEDGYLDAVARKYYGAGPS